jgi:hypothetical protein
MKRRNQKLKTIALFLATLMLMISIPYKPVLALMVSTEEMLDSMRVNDAREYVNHIIAREDVEQQLMKQGVDPFEVQARIDGLSNAEIIKLAEQIENLPAGRDALGTVVGAALLVFIILLVTDILGYTNVFSFVTKKGN